MKFYKLIPIKRKEFEEVTNDDRRVYERAEQSCFWVKDVCYVATKPDREINIDITYEDED